MTTTLVLEKYEEQLKTWPSKGKVLQAQYTDEYVVVYQAYNEEIAKYAVEHQHFGGPHFNFHRVSWVKPNFTWMMYRCGWCEKKNQERVLAIRLHRDFFDQVLENATHSSFQPHLYQSCTAWKQRLRSSDVVLQWDPDHEPISNKKYERRAIQLGLRPAMLEAFRGPAIIGIEDITDFVKACAKNVTHTPKEEVYPVKKDTTRYQLEQEVGKNQN